MAPILCANSRGRGRADDGAGNAGGKHWPRCAVDEDPRGVSAVSLVSCICSDRQVCTRSARQAQHACTCRSPEVAARGQARCWPTAGRTAYARRALASSSPERGLKDRAGPSRWSVRAGQGGGPAVAPQQQCPPPPQEGERLSASDPDRRLLDAAGRQTSRGARSHRLSRWVRPPRPARVVPWVKRVVECWQVCVSASSVGTHSRRPSGLRGLTSLAAWWPDTCNREGLSIGFGKR